MTEPEKTPPSHEPGKGSEPEKGSDISEWRPGDNPRDDRPTADDRRSDSAPSGGSDRGSSLSPARTRVIALIVAVFAAFGILWIGGEQHYQSCLAKVEAQTGGANDGLSRLVRKTALTKCSRSPF